MKDFVVDTHCHLNLGHLKEDIGQYVNNALLKGVKYLHTICTKISDFDDILNISNNFDNVYCSVGLHPCNVEKATIVDSEHLVKLAEHSKVISFGETGLDYYHPSYDKDLQKQSFVNHIIASQTLNLPVVVHTRNASLDTLDILASEMNNNEFSGIIHCFTEDMFFAKKILDLGLYISVAGIVTFKNASALQEVIKQVPLDRLLIETDSPYLAPTPMRSKPNEPAYVCYTAEFLANLYNISYSQIAEITTRNASQIFKKAQFLP